MKMDFSKGVVVAADKPDKTEIMRVIGEVYPYVDAIKVHEDFFKEGIIYEIKKEFPDSKIIADVKLADIPNTNRLKIQAYAQKGASGIIYQLFTGIFSAEACVQEAHNHEMIALGVCDMTQPGAAILYGAPIDKGIESRVREEFKRAEKVKEVADYSEALKKGPDAFIKAIKLEELLAQNATIGQFNAAVANYLGTDAIIAPGNKPEVIKSLRSITGPELWYGHPGIGVAQLGSSDVYSILGNKFLIVGRDIVNAPDVRKMTPAESAKDYMEKVAAYKTEKR
ncbi:MAG: orotidine 5'-phosphate decarboxylase [Candidatus Nanoarchaeia archaeon]|nr:orotidine 5'-phosphate decarboxylase [Candidatus Nanoarchaeia archaeon]MDD5239849.1 orotidine 5'-phosphate decarboxylase [Candidatus Nanoarchaeia archaeon]